MINNILENLALIVKYDRASVLLENGNELEIVAARGYPEGSNPLNIRVKVKENDVFHTIYRTQKPLSVREILNRPDWYQVEALPQVRSWAGLPLINAEDEVIGMLSLTRELPQPYTKDEIALGAAFAGQAAVALQNAGTHSSGKRYLSFSLVYLFSMLSVMGSPSNSVIISATPLRDIPLRSPAFLNPSFKYLFTTAPIW